MKRFKLILAMCVMAAAVAHGESDWRSEVSNEPAGNFPSLPDIKMHFSFGWSNVLKAAEADATIQRKGADYHAVVSGKTEGLARALWPLDAQHTATIQSSPLHPKHTAQIERYRSRTIETQVVFDSTGLNRLRKVSKSGGREKWKRVNFEPLYDIIGGVLYVRSQPLHVGDRIGLVCFPSDSPYVVIVTVAARENIRCMGKSRPALRLSLSVRKLEVKSKIPVKAVSYEKFHNATVWVSDDDLRLPLRAEANGFVGFVYGEMSSYELLSGPPSMR